MRAFNIRSGFAAAAILFATQIAADLDPIVIKVSVYLARASEKEDILSSTRAPNSFTKPMEQNCK